MARPSGVLPAKEDPRIQPEARGPGANQQLMILVSEYIEGEGGQYSRCPQRMSYL
jgi:hypothetical protein